MDMDENGQNGQGDSDEGAGAEGKLCRDFMRNVCNRGSNCRFIHPNDVKIKTDPIFCHDYQQSKCFRSTCKFIHCSREDEEHFKTTGELPQDFTGGEQYRAGRPIRGGPKIGGRGGPPMRGARGGGRGGGGGRGWVDNDDPEIPICKDYLKGVCDRPPGGCKFRHVDESYGGGGGGGGRGGMLGRRRMGGPGYYEEGPEAKRSYDGYGGGGRLTDFEDYYNPEYSNPPPPPPPTSYPMGAAAGRSMLHGNGDGAFGTGRNGLGGMTMTSDASSLLNSYSSVTAMKAMEDENFMLKRRIEELKKQVSDLVATNEYLLSQNATLRLTNMQKDGQNVGTSVVSLVSMAQPQPMGLTPSMSVAATQSLSTMSTLTMPTVSMSLAPAVSMSQPLEAVVSLAQHQSMTQGQPQTVYPMVIKPAEGQLPW